jgi:hypothetical protein
MSELELELIMQFIVDVTVKGIIFIWVSSFLDGKIAIYHILFGI